MGNNFLEALSDKTRLKMILLLSNSPMFVEEFAMQLNISISTASFHLKKLSAAGIVVSKKEQYYRIYELKLNPFSSGIIKSFDFKNEYENKFIEEVKKDCFVGGRVEKLPVQILKRKVIYQIILEGVSDDIEYQKNDICGIIGKTTNDITLALKEMVDFGFLKEVGGKIVKVKG